MKSLVVVPAAVAVLAASVSPALSQNSVYIESKTVVAGARGVEVGVYLSNIPYVALVHIPLQFREVTPGAFIADTILLTGQGRLIGTLDQANSEQYFATQEDTLGIEGCWWTRAQPDFLSPDAVFYFSPRGLVRHEFCLPPGSDGLPYSGGDVIPPPATPSLVLRFDVTDVPGTLEIDSACVGQEGLRFAECYGPIVFTPAFTKGVVTIVPCTCNCHGDPICDGVHDAADLVKIIGEAFGSQSAQADSECGRKTRNDINCDCQVNIADVVGMIDVAFRGKSPELGFCGGCSDNCP